MTKKYSFEAVLASILFIVLFFVILLQILGRVTPIPGPIWTEEAARWIWVWMALVAIGAVEKEDAHLRMGFFVGMLPKTVQTFLNVLFDLVYLALVGHLIWIAYKSVLRTWNNEAVSLPATDAVLYASGLAAMILIFHRVARRIIGLRSASRNAEGEA